MHKIIKFDCTLETGSYEVQLQDCNVAALINSTIARADNSTSASMELEDVSPKLAMEAILKDAQLQAAEILEQAELDAAVLKKTALEEGMAAGTRIKEDNIIQSENLLAYVKNIREEIIRYAEPQVIELSLQIAQALVKNSMLLDPTLIKEIVAEAITLLATEESIIVKVNPDDLTMCRSHKGYFSELLADNTSIRFLPSEDVDKGDCIAHGQYASVESYLQERFAMIRTSLLKEAVYANRQA